MRTTKWNMTCAFCILSILLVVSVSAVAKLMDVKQVPNGKKNSCANCHQPGDKSSSKLTPFGNDYRENGKKWDATLANKDSDGDKMTNGEELGNPSGSWKKGDSEPDGPVFNPGDATSFK